jgi:hypothetical protein
MTFSETTTGYTLENKEKKSIPTYTLTEVISPNFQGEATRKKGGFAFDTHTDTKYFELDKKTPTKTWNVIVGQGMLEYKKNASWVYEPRYLKFGRPDKKLDHDYWYVTKQQLPAQVQEIVANQLKQLNALHQLESEIKQ